MAGGERGRDRSSSRIADQVKALDPARVRLTQDTVDLEREPEGLVRGRLVGRIHLEVLGVRPDIGSQRLDQGSVGEILGQHGAG